MERELARRNYAKLERGSHLRCDSIIATEEKQDEINLGVNGFMLCTPHQISFG
jgi:hypothetical protein